MSLQHNTFVPGKREDTPKFIYNKQHLPMDGEGNGLPLETRPDSLGESGMQPQDPCRP